MRSPILLFALVLLAPFGPGQDRHTAFIKDRYPSLAKVRVQHLVADARAAGLVRTMADQVACKRALYALRRSEGMSRPHALCDLPLIGPPGARDPADLVVMETEYNDAPPYAEDLGTGANTGSGSIDKLGDDADLWSWTSAGEIVHIEVLGSGTAPLRDSTLRVRTAAGLVVAWDDDGGAGMLSRLECYLPAGQYTFEVAEWRHDATGSYDLVVTPSPAVIQTPTGPGPFVGATGDVWQLVLSQDAHVSLQVSGLAGVDLAMCLSTDSGAVVFQNDDGPNAPDPAMAIDLPAGTYNLSVWEVTGAPAGYTLQYTASPQPMIDLCVTPQITASIAGEHARAAYRLDLSTGNHSFNITTVQGSVGTSIGDSVLYLFDANLAEIAAQDQAGGNFARIAGALPAGMYHVMVGGFGSAAGSVDVRTTCSPVFAPGAMSYGDNPTITMGNGRFDLFELSVCTEVGVRITADEEFFVVDSTGRALVNTTTSSMDHGATTLPAGKNYVGVLDRFGLGQPVNVDINAPTRCDAVGDLVTQAKAGDLVFLFASLAPLDPGISTPPAQGLLCLPGTNLVTVALMTAPPAGTISWFPCNSVPSLYLQAGDLHGTGWVISPGLATWRNRLVLP